MKHLLSLVFLGCSLSLLAGCGDQKTATTPDKIPPMPKGDKQSGKPDMGGSAKEG